MTPTVPVWSLALGETAILAVRARRTPEGRLQVLGWWTVPVPGGADPVSVAVAAARKRRLQDHGIVLVLPGRGGTCRSARVAAEDADLTDAELSRELAEYTSHEATDVELRWRRLGAPGTLDFRVVAERRDVLAAARSAFAAAGFPHVATAAAAAGLAHAAEGPGLLPRRGFVVDVEARWTRVLALDLPLVTQYLVPFGRRHIEEAIAARAPGARPAAVEAAPVTDTAAAQVLDAAVAPLAADVRRTMEYHRSVQKGAGDDMFAVVGAAAEPPALRAALLRLAPVTPWAAAAGAVAAGPGVRPDALVAVLPVLAAPLGAAAAALGVVAADLEFSRLPEDLPLPRERTLYPVAAAVLAASTTAALVLGGAGAAAGRAAPPAGAPAGAPAGGDREVLALADRAARVASFRHALAAIEAAAPTSDGAGLVAAHVVADGDGHAVSVRIEGVLDAERAAAGGWTVVRAEDGFHLSRRVAASGGAPGRVR